MMDITDALHFIGSEIVVQRNFNHYLTRNSYDFDQINCTIFSRIHYTYKDRHIDVDK